MMCVSCGQVKWEGWLGPTVLLVAVVGLILLANHCRRRVRAWVYLHAAYLSTLWAKVRVWGRGEGEGGRGRRESAPSLKPWQ